ncbi:MAG: hypothetical protein ABI797_01530 [Chloroflexota bacterium]
MNVARRAWERVPDGLRRTVGLRAVRRSISTSRYIAEHNRRLPATAPMLTFYPMRPQPRAQVVTMLALIGVRIGVDIRRSGPAIAWHSGTLLPAADAAALPAWAINRGCTDISKSRVDELWGRLAGYSISVDPLRTAGPIVVKSEANGRHDGRVVHGPLRQRRAGVVYQRFIDATVGDAFMEARPVIIGGRMPLALESRRPRPHWATDALATLPRQPGELYSADEIETMLRFASAIGLDYGELDAVRETSSGNLYVLDANRTPTRPHFIPRDAEAEAMALMAATFANAFADVLAMTPE